MQKLSNTLLMLLPSSKLKKDVQISYNKLENLKPISIKEISLTSFMKYKILKIREYNNNVTIQRGNKKLSVIIPYRNREIHLKTFLPALENRLNQQKIDYEIIIAEQDDTFPFNRAKLMNIGTLNARKESDYYIYHDVDAMPTNIDYRYCNQTLKLFNYIKRETIFEEYPETVFGGVTLVPKQIFFDINGFSNKYWQWGKEDDDFLFRHLLKGYVPFFDTKGKLDMLPHPRALTLDTNGNVANNNKILKINRKHSQRNKKNFSKFKRGVLNQDLDGVNSINNYTITSIETLDNIKTIKIKFNP